MSSHYRTNSVTLRPEAVLEFTGDIYDLDRNSPEHLRVVTWARLERLTLDEPRADGQARFEHAAGSTIRHRPCLGSRTTHRLRRCGQPEAVTPPGVTGSEA
ncbi:hypothetical protein [Mycolicibacter algericus]|uniref:Uncharacterized protein n=1 Tax=Mycolicibacter algericus TaxID=1288388 RepID=A0A7I9YBF0_MYCAL|nr:hypothetical protein [Mycolicibacter algericus]GFG85987.1 hypothetical protein MALGJ_26630 [Mycolicibacter algericus]